MSLVNLDSPSFRTGSTTQMSSSENEMCSDEPLNEEDEEERMSSPEDELMEPKGMDGLVTEGHRAPGDERSFGMRDMAQIWQLKKVFSGMEEEYERKINAVDISRADLKFCQERLELLQLQRNELEQKLTMAEEESNRPAVDLARAQLVKVDETISNETDLEKTLREAVKEAELMLLKADMEVSGYVDAMRTLEEDEADIKLMKMKQYNDRLAKEDQLMERFLLRKRNLERKQRKEMLDKEEQRKKALLEAKRAHEVTVALMQESLEKERARKESEEAESRQLLEKRVSAVLSLKKNIDAQREVMKKSQSARNSKIAATSQRESELDAADIIKQKRLEEFSKQKEKFDRVRREREVTIADKLIKEEERLKQMKEKLNQPHWKPRDSSMPTKPQMTAKRSKPMQGKQERQKEKSGVDDDEESSRGVQSDGPLHSVVVEERPVGTSEVAREEKDRPVEEDKVICPEFDGLWSGPVASTGAPHHHVIPGGEDPDVKKEHKYTMSKMEQDILKNHLETQRRLITQKQVVAGIEFKGPAFKSNPETIEFKDFEVGKEYKKTVQLTNISYTVNTCKLVGLSEELKDFISIKFTPPGLMSAGIACSLVVTFEPQIDEDLFGEIEMLAQTGSFSIPIKCLKKRCIVEMNQCVVDFDRVCIGECATRNIVLKNIGALGTGFQIAKLPLVDASLAEHSINPEREAVNMDDKLRAATPTSVIMQSEEQQERVDHELKENGVGVLDVKEKDDTSDVKDSVDAQHNKDEVPGEVGPTIELSKQGYDSEVIEGDDRPPDHTESSPPPATRQDPVSRESPHLHSSEQTRSLQLSDCVTIDPESGLLSSQSEVVLQVTFNPDRLGELDTTLSVDFSDDTVDRIIVHVKGSCVDIPVSVENDVTDFGICEVGRLYQTSLNFHNSSSKSIQMSFQIPKASQSYLDILPEQVALNPSSSSAVQVKFYPKSPLCSDVSEEQFRAEVMGRIPNQTLPVRFNILATLTTPSLEFGTSQMDFGCCGTQESVRCALDVTNKSLLPQQVGFIGLPNTVDVQPCDGFLTLLPLETVSLDVIVSPIKPGPFSFDLTCMTANGRKYHTPCKGSVVQSPLRLDSNTVYFAGTPVYSSAVATVTLMCDKTKHKGPKLTSRAFWFCLPDNSPVSVSPLAGIIAEGKKQKIQVQFQPKLDKLAVSTEADNLALQAEQEAKMILEAAKAKREEEAQKELMSSQKSRKTPGSTKGKPQKSGVVGTSEATCDVPHSIKIDPAHYHSAAQQKLLANYSTEELHLRIPCFVSSSDCVASTEQSYRREETIFLDVHARSVRPSLIVASQHGMTKMDFGKVAVGERIVKEIHIKNISNSAVEVVSPLLDPTGPFEILNAFRRIDPGRKHAVVVAFAPQEPSDFFEPLHLTYGEGSFLNLTFSGKGVTCDVDVEGIERGVIDFGHVLSGDVVTKMLKLKNNTPVPIGYAVTLDATTKEVSNFSGSSVFEFNPACGEITPGSTRDVTVTFLPDHPSLLYANRSHITINTENKAFQFHLKGKVWANSMYLLPGEIDPTLLESLLPQTHDQASLVVNFVRCLRDDTLSIASRQVEIGCIKSSSLKKSGGDYSFDPIQGTDAKCFTIEPMKATVEGGGHKMVTLSFTPPKGESHSTMEGNTVLTLKGEPNAQQIIVVLRGIVVD